ncbi:MAG TPA: ABC transporter permease, partial [Psychromonas sp.]
MTVTSLTNKLAVAAPSLANLRSLFKSACQLLALPLLGITLFLLLWTITAKNIHTSLGDFPGPSAVYQQFHALYDEHSAERKKADNFYLRQESKNAARVAKDPNYLPKVRKYTGKETFFDQIVTSLITVSSGFLLAAMIAIPLGIAMGLSKNLNSAVNPIVQIFKPVSPLAWLPLVTMVVSALYI